MNAENITGDELRNALKQMGMKARQGALQLANVTTEAKNRWLSAMADAVEQNAPALLAANAADMEKAAKIIFESYGCAVLCKGGHSLNDANDILYNGETKIFKGKKISTTNTHGTGCTLSSAIAAGLAKNLSLIDAICAAKNYISGALNFGLNLGKGSGPMNHAFLLNNF